MIEKEKKRYKRFLNVFI